MNAFPDTEVSGSEVDNNQKENAFLDKVKSEMTSLIKKEYGDKIPEGLKETIEKGANKADLEKVTTQLNDLGLKVKAFTEKEERPKVTNFTSAFLEGFKVLAKDNALKSLKRGDWANLEVKVAGTMFESTNVLPSVVGAVPFTLAEHESGLTRPFRRRPFLLDIMNIGSTVKSIIQWAEMVNIDGAAVSVAEGAPKPQIDFDIQEASAKVEKVAAFIKISTEMLDDIDYIQAEINHELIERIKLKVDELLLTGNGITPNIKGILEYSQPFAASTFALTIEGANIFDVIRVAINQVEANGFVVNYVVMNPTDVASMDLAKDGEGRYLMPPFIASGMNSVKGVPIIANIGMPQGTFLVGDFTKANVRIRKDAAISVGYVNDDFTRNLVTILAEMRLVLYVKTNHLGAFVDGTFATAIAALEKP